MTPEQLARMIDDGEAALTMRLARVLAIEELHAMGMSYRSIGTVLGLSHTQVRRIAGTFEVPPLGVGE